MTWKLYTHIFPSNSIARDMEENHVLIRDCALSISEYIRLCVECIASDEPLDNDLYYWVFSEDSLWRTCIGVDNIIQLRDSLIDIIEVIEIFIPALYDLIREVDTCNVVDCDYTPEYLYIQIRC